MFQFRDIGLQDPKIDVKATAPLQTRTIPTAIHMAILYPGAKSRYKRKEAMLSLAKSIAIRFVASPIQIHLKQVSSISGVIDGS
jgi:hypothetical protein